MAESSRTRSKRIKVRANRGGHHSSTPPPPVSRPHGNAPSPPSPQTIFGLNSVWLPDEESRNFYGKFKPLTHLQFYFDFTGFSNNLHRIPNWFRNLNLTNFVTRHNLTYDEMTKMFYANKVASPPNLFTTSVCDHEITITRDLIAQIFHIPCDGIDVTSRTLDFPDFYKIICDDSNRTSLEKPKYHELNAETRLLFLFFSHLLCKQGNHTDFPKTEQNLVYCIKTGRMVNFPSLILEIMHTRRAHRPFHMFLTPIFDHFNIPLYGEGFLRVEQCINLAKITGPLHIERVRNKFVIKQAHVGSGGASSSRASAMAHDGGHINISDDDDDVEPPTFEEYVDNSIIELRHHIDSRFDKIEATQASQQTHLDRMDGKLDRLLAHFHISSPPPGADM